MKALYRRKKRNLRRNTHCFVWVDINGKEQPAPDQAKKKAKRKSKQKAQRRNR